MSDTGYADTVTLSVTEPWAQDLRLIRKEEALRRGFALSYEESAKKARSVARAQFD